MSRWIAALAWLGLSATFANAGDIVWKQHTVNAKSDFEAASAFDVNNDGKIDIVSGDTWYEAPDWKPHHVRDVERAVMNKDQVAATVWRGDSANCSEGAPSTMSSSWSSSTLRASSRYGQKSQSSAGGTHTRNSSSNRSPWRRGPSELCLAPSASWHTKTRRCCVPNTPTTQLAHHASTAPIKVLTKRA